MTTHLHFSAIGRSLLCVTLILLGATGLMAQAFSSQGSYGGATLAIPDWPIAGCGEQLTDLGGTTVLSATANVSGLPVGGNVTSITVETAINHTWVGDLDIFVEAPDGSILQLVAGAGAGTATACGASDDLVSTSPITFSDTAPQSAETMGSTTGSTVCADDGICDYSPDNDGNLLTAGTNGPQVFSFADFYPQSDGLNGNWTLYIADGGGGDTGDLVDFTVTVSGEEIACVDAAAPTIDDATARPVCDETFTMMTEMDYVYTVTPPSDGVSSSRDCRSAVIWRTPRFSDDCGVDSLAIVFSAESMPAATIIPDPLTYGSGSPEIMAQETDGYVQIITPSTYFYGSGASASTTTRVTYEVFDAEGNMETCFFFIEVVDNEDPIIDACPEDFEIAGDETSVGNGEGSDLAYSEVEVTITEAQFTAEGGDIDENCGVETITYIDVQAGTDPIIVTRTFTVTDYVGLAASCEQTITINPCIVELTCQDVTVYVDDAGNTSITPEEIQVSGSCDNTNLSLSQADFDCGDVANMPVTVTLFQNEGAQNEVSCTAEITVLDTIRPEVTCVPSFTLYLDDDGQFADPNSANFVFDNITIDTSDNCAVSGTIDRTRTLDADCTNTGEDIMVTYGFRDFSDNVTQCTVALIVLDTTPPAPVCMDLTVQLDGEGNGSIATDDNTMSQIDGGSSDNCGPLTFSEDITDFDCADIGPNTVTLTVTDPSGNVTTCDATVTVEDMVPPTLVCQDVAVFIDDMGLATVMDTSLAIMSLTDNCTDSAAIDIALIAPELGCDETTGTATLTATDIAGNVANCTIGLMAVDTISPVMTCANTVHFADEDCLFQGNAGMWTNGDNCDGIGLLEEEYFDEDGNNFLNLFFDFSANISAVLGNNRGFPLGVNTVRLTFTDASGNSGACEFTVTIEDNTPPDVVTTDQMLTLTDDEPTMTLTTGDLATATDNCGEPITIEFDRSLTFTGADIGTNELTVTVTDASGNETVTTVTVVVGFEQPNLACVSEINLTLNDDCQGLLIPRMFLTGNTALLDAFQFDITVDDNDPSNGPIVDGCGRFRYSISPASLGDEPTIGFTGDFAPENWTEILFSFLGGAQSPPSDEQLITVDFTADAMTLMTEATVFNTGSEFGAQQGIMFSESGVVAFDYNFNGVDAGFDQAFSITTFEGVTVEIPFNTVNPESGSVSVNVEPGYSLIVQLRDDGFQPFAGQAASTLTLENFSFTPPVSPLTLDFETCWGWVNAEDKTPPAVVATPDDVDLLCVDLDANILTTLGASVSKCYRVNSGTGATIPGSMASALRARLLAGGTAPLVPTFTDGCTQEIEVCVNDVLVYDEEDPSCNDVVLTRTFTATEIAVCPAAAGEGNPSVTAAYTITFSRPDLDDLSADNIEPVVNYELCGTANPTRADYPAPRTQDFPFLEIGGRTFNLTNGDAVCNIGVTYSDGEAVVTCPFTYKFVRTYTVIDWCDPSDVRTFTQVVKVGDTTAPTFSGPTQDRDFDGVVDSDLIYTTNAGNVCAAYIRLDAGISATDNCSDDVTITAVIYPGADLSATPIGAFDVDPTDNRAEVTSAIPVGCHLLRYTYTDECGNTDFSDYPFCVEDGTAPVAICEDGLNISISSGSAAGGVSTGIAILTPEMIDAGSYDDCSGVTLEIARVGADNIATEAYDQELVLTCADLGTVRVGLKVTDAEGNMNFCWLDVLVEDKNAPSCIAPGPVEISCIVARATLPDDIMEATEAELDATFGFATGVDNCDVTITSTISGNVNSCGVGSFTRIFTATDGEGFTNTNNCRQRITVYGVHDYRLTFPTDEEGTCADVPAYAGIAADEDACDLITTDVVVDTLRTLEAGEECFKLRVTYDVINWCEYNTLGQPYLIPRDGDGIRNPETQVLYLNVNPGTDDQTTADDFAFLSRFADRSYNPNAPQRDQLLDDGDDADGSDDDNSNDNDNEAYAADNSRGHFRYIQFIKIYDEVAPTIDADEPADCFAGTSLTCTAEVELTFTALDECSDADVQIELDANYVAGAGFTADNPATLGVGVSLSNDGMGGFTINATNVPVGNHAVRVRASDGCGNFDVEIIEFCVEGDKAPTPICISQLTVTLMPDGQGGGMAAIWASDFIASDVEDCFGNVIDKYSIYTEEEAGAAGFAPAAGRLGIDLDCDDDSTVPVRVYAIDDNGSADYCAVFVLVQLFQEDLCTGTGGNLAGNIATQDNDLMEGVEVNLTGNNDMDEMVMTAANGGYSFTSLPLNADYTVEASYSPEVDLSQVKVSDVVKIGSVILGTSTFDNGYDFVAGDVDQDGSLSIFDMVAIQRVILGNDETFATGETWRFVTEEYNLTASNWATTFPEVYNVNDLAGVLSDVDFVAIEMGNVVREGGRSALNLETEDTSLEAGQTHTMILTAAEMRGFQGTIALAAGLELIDVTFEGEGGLNLNRAGEGLIGVAMHEAISLTLEVRATEAGRLSELVSLTETLVRTEGVNLNGESTGLGLAFNGSSLAPAVSALLQNTPNPVVDATTIRFELATAGPATLSIQDAAGRIVLVRQLDALAGMNRVDLTSKDLGAAGVLTYTLTAGDFSATKKMVVVR